MKREQMNQIVRFELSHIPRGMPEQNLFRATYNMVRRHDLATEPATPAGESLRKALEQDGKVFPGFHHNYDRGFFNV